jgi:hypothetical protein
MAINVDQVYKTVLLVINKEQRGYLTPDEFNKIATQVQLEIVDNYFQTINQQMRVPQNESEYGNRYKNVQLKLDAFKTIGNGVYNAATATTPAYFDIPVSNPVSTGFQTFASSTTATGYPLTTITQAEVEQSSVVVTIENPTGAAAVPYAANNWNIEGGIFTTLNSATGLPQALGAGQTININLYSENFYKLGTAIYKEDREVQLVQRNELAQLNMSPISKPSEHFPVALWELNKLTVYPQTINSDLQMTYIRKPLNVKWNFDATAGYYVYDPTTSVNFELDKTEQTNVILQILVYAGITIKDPQIVQAASQEVMMEEQNEKS